MQEAVIGLLSARTGHFRYESGHHGNVCLQRVGLWSRPAPLSPVLLELGRRLANHEIEGICGPQAGGAFVAYAIAAERDLPFFVTERIVEPGSGAVRYHLPDSLRE